MDICFSELLLFNLLFVKIHGILLHLLTGFLLIDQELGKNVISLQVDIMVSKCSSENVHTEVTEINTVSL